MNLHGIRWLEIHEPGFGRLVKEEKSEIIDFCMLWSFFEGKFLHENASVNSIRKFVGNLESNGKFTKLKFDDCIQYFKERYVQDGNFTENYQTLYLEKSANPVEVNEMLTNENSTEVQKLIGCLVIVFRFRNNLFHGVKWQYNFHGQLDNFTHANSLLKKLIQLD